MVNGTLGLFGLKLSRVRGAKDHSSPPPLSFDGPPIRELNVLALCVGDALRKHVVSGGTSDNFHVVQIGAFDGIRLDLVRPFITRH